MRAPSFRAVLSGLALKVMAETPWGEVLRHPAGWDIAVVPFAHASGLAAGLKENSGQSLADVEAALRALLRHKPDAVETPPLPEFRSGGARVDIANRAILYDVMEQ